MAPIILYKNEGETPLERLKRYQNDHPPFKDRKMTYAGRLDPMAEGLLIILSGEEVREKEAYLNLDKEYRFEILFGYATDTYDILGIVTDVKEAEGKFYLEEKIREALPKCIGSFQEKYPPFSSKTVGGKPLFELAKTEMLNESEIPVHEVTINELILESIHEEQSSELYE